ncbi:SigE family RNA polymerase sigma factor [Streptomyces sp. NPDC090108]|uniref:SigE family RNA polymerase sigma factor n=1 Tax=Streptomyces sp. NPDC090108 TaxID=3365947 RepID=UPI00382F9E67
MTTPVCTSASAAAAPARQAAPHAPPARHSPPAPAPVPTPRAASPSSSSSPSSPSRPSRQAPPSYPSHAGYASFSSYVRARQTVLLRTARSLTANPSDAEDLLQTALAKTYVAWERIEDHRALDGYVRRALLNTRTSQWRKRRVDEFACDELPEPDPVPGTQDQAERQALHDAMWRAVAKLPARQRAMVVLRYYEDLSEARTAEVLGVSVGTVKSAVSRALGKLREDPELGLVR